MEITAHNTPPPGTSVTDQARERGEPFPADGTSAKELRARGYVIRPEINDAQVIVADAASPTGGKWCWHADALEDHLREAPRPLTAGVLRDFGVLPAGTTPPPGVPVSTFDFDWRYYLISVSYKSLVDFDSKETPDVEMRLIPLVPAKP